MNGKLFHITLLIYSAFSLNAQDPNFIDGSELAGMYGTTSNYSAAIVDIDQDGLEDIYIGSKNQPNKLYRNNGDGTFSNIAEALGIDDDGNASTSIWADFDNDGDPDGYVGNYAGSNNYFRNNGDGTFDDIALDLGVGGSGNTRCVITADVNSDGHLDIYVINLNQANEFYLSDGNGGFIDHYLASGATDSLVGMGAVFFDSDNDGDEDLYLLHDAYQANKFYVNNGSGYFTEQASILGLNHQGEGMGVDVTDFNHDGWFDIYINNNYDGNTLFLNNGDGSFSDISESADIIDNGMGWGLAWLDCNLNGHKDIYIANNYAFTPFPNVLYINNGDSTFTKLEEGSVLDSEYVGSAIAIADLDLNGTEDIVVANPLNANNPGVQLFWNETTGNNWINLKLTGNVSNRDAIGSIVKVYCDELFQMDIVSGGSGYSQMNSLSLTFGLSQNTVVDSVQVIWPNGLTETFGNLEINTSHTLVEGSGSVSVLLGNFNGDGVVNMYDLLILLSQMGCSGEDCVGDLNNDGQVNTMDLLYFLQILAG